MNFYMSNSNLIPRYSFPPSQIPYLYLSSAAEASCLAPNSKITLIQFFILRMYIQNGSRISTPILYKRKDN